ncbi:MAG: hypothetical protein HY908_12920 [Myxococcales bacterium]|nr:hypothetical protein [Myxococcales bacterium]
MTSHRIDPDTSKILLRTKATGLLARFAHDLEIEARAPQLTVTVEDASWSAELRVLVPDLRVLGVRRGGRVDTGVLSHDDRLEVERKIREEVLRAGEVRVTASGTSRRGGTAAVRVGKGEQKVELALEARAEDGGFAVTGSARLSMRALGLREIKGPLGAFKVDDTVEVALDVHLVAV